MRFDEHILYYIFNPVISYILINSFKDSTNNVLNLCHEYLSRMHVVITSFKDKKYPNK